MIRGTLAAISVVTLCAALADADGSKCTADLGFDPRLIAEAFTQFPLKAENVVGFEMIGGTPVVATLHKILAVSGGKVAIFPSLDGLVGLGTDARGLPFVRTRDSAKQILGGRLVSDDELSRLVPGAIFNSGTGTMMVVTDNGGWTTFAAVGARTWVPLANVEGRFRAGSWNHQGLAAVVGNSLIAWRQGDHKLTRLLIDEGLESAQDACLLGPDLAVVALKSTVLLVNRVGATMLVAMRARCRLTNGVLYLLDTTSGTVWKVKGMERIQNARADRDYAKQLLQQVKKSSGNDDERFRQAARIIGCGEAQKLLSSVGK